MQQQEEELTLWERCKEEIYARTWWLGPEQQDVRPLQVPIKLRDPATKKDEPLPLPQPCLSEAKPKFEPDCSIVAESLPIALSLPSVCPDLPQITHMAENPQPYPQAIVEMPVGVHLCEPHSFKDL
jgi:hypothetical protein